MSPVEAVTQIRDLCDDAGYAGLPSNLIARIRAVLDAVSVDATPAQGIDRDALTELLAEEIMFGSDGSDGGYLRRVADRILALVRPTPAQGIDRDALHGLVHRYTTGHLGTTEFEAGILALVRPVEFTVDPEVLDRHAIELEARTRLPLGYARESLMRLVDVLIPAVRPVEGAIPARGIDRDALTEQVAELLDVVRHAGQDWTWAHNLSLAVVAVFEKHVALVRPVEGVVLSPEEARLLVSTLHRTDEWHAVHFAALAARLEES